MQEFGKLLCGTPTDDLFELKNILSNMKYKLELYTNRILDYNWDNGNIDMILLFYARNILETSLTALLGRYDPFRVIAVYKVQSLPNYEMGKRSKSAIEWSGDIIAKSRPNILWDNDSSIDKFDRALLSNHNGDIIWKNGFSALSDYLDNNNSEWLAEIMNLTENANFEKVKSVSAELFSNFSKGVHSEYLVDVSLMFDFVTIKTKIKDLFKLCASLGLVSHFIGIMKSNISVEDAITNFCRVEERINEL